MSARQQIISWILIVCVLSLLLYLLRAILLPFVAGAAVAYLLDPLADWLEARGQSRTLATSTILFGFFGIMLLLLVLLLPIIEEQVIGFFTSLPGIIIKTRDWLIPLVRRLLADLPEQARSEVQHAAATSAESGAALLGQLAKGALGSGLALFNLLSLILITPVVAFYLLRDWDRILARIDTWLPREHGVTIRQQLREMNKVLAGFVRGQAGVCFILGCYYAIGLSVAGLQFGLVIGIATGILVFIPIIGASLGFLAAIIVALAQFWPDYLHIGIVVGIYLIGQFLEGNLISPKLIGERVGLHPVWVMFALLAFGTLFGFLGVLLAVPVAAVIGVLTRFALSRYLDSRLYHGREP